MELEQSRRMLRIVCGGEEMEICWKDIRQLVRAPQVHPVPGAPLKAAGIMEFQGGLVGVLCGEASAGPGVCAVVLEGEDGGCYGLLADEIDGGAYGDT